MPTCHCTVLALSAGDVYKIATFPFQFHDDHAPGAMFAFPLERELGSITGDSVDDPGALLADDQIRSVLAARVGRLAAGYVTMRGTTSVEEARAALMKGLAARSQNPIPWGRQTVELPGANRRRVVTSTHIGAQEGPVSGGGPRMGGHHQHPGGFRPMS